MVMASTDSQAAAAALKREIRLLEKGNAQLRKDVEEAKVQVSNEVLLRVMADKHCEQEQATLSQLRKGLALAKKQVNRHSSEIQSFEQSIMISRSMITEVQNSIADASQEGVGASDKTPQNANTSRSGSATSRSRGRGRSPGSPKKPYGASASLSEVHAGPSAPDSSALDNHQLLKDKLVAKDGENAPRNAQGNQAEAEMLGHIHKTSAGMAEVVDHMADLSKSLSVAASASKVEKNDGIIPIKDKHYCAVLATRPPPEHVKKYMF